MRKVIYIRNANTIPCDIDQFYYVNRVDFYECLIQDLTPEFCSLKLTELGMNKCNLLTIPQKVFSLTTLTKLSIYKNLISIVPKEIEQLQCLERLDLSWNFIRHLPLEICNIPSIKIIWISNNFLQTLPKELKKIPACTIYANNNRITILSKELDTPKICVAVQDNVFAKKIAYIIYLHTILLRKLFNLLE